MELVFIMWLRHFLFIAIYRFSHIFALSIVTIDKDIFDFHLSSIFFNGSSFAWQSDTSMHKYFIASTSKEEWREFKRLSCAVNKILFNYSAEIFIFLSVDIVELYVCREAMSNSKVVGYWRNNNLLKQRNTQRNVLPPLARPQALLLKSYSCKLKINNSERSAWMKKLISCFIWQFVLRRLFSIIVMRYTIQQSSKESINRMFELLRYSYNVRRDF